MLQRRIVLELPHEVTDDARMDILRQFCAQTFGLRGIPYHAVIHAPAGGNDDRNFHAHIVSTHHQICRDKATGRWDFLASEKMPAVHDFGRKITGNAHSPEGEALPAANRRTIQRQLFQELRQIFATAANNQLRMEAVLKRYDPRSYHDRGLAITPGSHLGPAAAAAAKRGDSVGRSPHRAGWLNAAAALAAAAPDEDPEEVRRLVDTEMVFQSLPPDCLPPDCHQEIQAARHRLARLRAKVERSFFALAAPAQPARPTAPALPQRPVPPSTAASRPASVPDPLATSQRPIASGTDLAIHGIHLTTTLRTTRPQATARAARTGLLAPAFPQRPASPSTGSPRSVPVPDPQATSHRPTASGANLAIPGILRPPALRTAHPQAISRPRRASLLAPALPQRPAPPPAETPRPAPVPDPQATPQRPTASGAELAVPGILPPPAFRTARPKTIARPRRASLLAPAFPQRPASPSTGSPRSVPVPDPQATSHRPTASGANLAIPGILRPPALRTAHPQAISRPRRASLLAPALPQRPAPPPAETPRPATVPDPQATPQRPTASGAELAVPGILPPPAFRTARPKTIARPRRASLLAPAFPQRPASPSTGSPRSVPVPDPQATSQRPTASGANLAIPGILRPPALRTAHPQAISRPRRASLLAPALPQRPAPPPAETPRPATVRVPHATPQRVAAPASSGGTVDPPLPDDLRSLATGIRTLLPDLGRAVIIAFRRRHLPRLGTSAFLGPRAADRAMLTLAPYAAWGRIADEQVPSDWLDQVRHSRKWLFTDQFLDHDLPLEIARSIRELHREEQTGVLTPTPQTQIELRDLLDTNLDDIVMAILAAPLFGEKILRLPVAGLGPTAIATAVRSLQPDLRIHIPKRPTMLSDGRTRAVEFRQSPGRCKYPRRRRMASPPTRADRWWPDPAAYDGAPAIQTAIPFPDGDTQMPHPLPQLPRKSATSPHRSLAQPVVTLSEGTVDTPKRPVRCEFQPLPSSREDPFR